VEARRLAGPVRADQPEDLAGSDREVDVVQRGEATELHRDVVDLEEGDVLSHARGIPCPPVMLSSVRPASRISSSTATGPSGVWSISLATWRRGHRPCGRKIISTTSRTSNHKQRLALRKSRCRGR